MFELIKELTELVGPVGQESIVLDRIEILWREAVNAPQTTSCCCIRKISQIGWQIDTLGLSACAPGRVFFHWLIHAHFAAQGMQAVG